MRKIVLALVVLVLVPVFAAIAGLIPNAFACGLADEISAQQLATLRPDGSFGPPGDRVQILQIIRITTVEITPGQAGKTGDAYITSRTGFWSVDGEPDPAPRGLRNGPARLDQDDGGCALFNLWASRTEGGHVYRFFLDDGRRIDGSGDVADLVSRFDEVFGPMRALEIVEPENGRVTPETGFSFRWMRIVGVVFVALVAGDQIRRRKPSVATTTPDSDA